MRQCSTPERSKKGCPYPKANQSCPTLTLRENPCFGAGKHQLLAQPWYFGYGLKHTFDNSNRARLTPIGSIHRNFRRIQSTMMEL